MGRISMRFPVFRIPVLPFLFDENLRIGLDGVKTVDTSGSLDGRKRQENQGFPPSPNEKQAGDVVQLVRTLPCHGRGRGFESRRPRHSF